MPVDLMMISGRTKAYVVLLAVIVVLIAVAYTYISNNSNSNLAKYDDLPINLSTYEQMKSIATNLTLAQQIGIGAAENPVKNIAANSLVIDGKPGIIYVGADYCPFCAATRWPIILALMRFGDFSTLHYMTSDTTDVWPSTPTFTFYNSTYTSQYIIFLPTETTSNTGQPLQSLIGVSNITFSTYDTSGIPFVDFANQSILSGSLYSPGLINKMDWNQIVAQLSNPNSTVTQAIIGSTNVFTAEICKIDNFTPSNVCSQPYINRILSAQQ